MGRIRYAGHSRDSGGFVALPFAVIDSPAYQSLSMHARALLVEISRQYRGGNNGSLLCSRAYMLERGWKSADMLTKAKAELLESRLLYQTVQGHRPNKASWYAVTWCGLDKLDGFDAGAAQGFVRGAYRTLPTATNKPTREELYRRWDAPQKTRPLDRPTVQEEA